VKKEVTIQEVANQANVSVPTVSRILNDRPDVSTATRERVQKVIQELGYVPRAQAQSLAVGKSSTIALLFPLEHAQATQLELSFVLGAARASEDEGFYFNLLTTPMSDLSLERLYRSARVDGAIIMQVSMDDPRVDYLLRQELDFVMIGRTRDVSGLSYVDFDFENAVVRMFTYLYRLGHRRIGFITRPEHTRREGVGSSVRLYNGFHRITEELGIRKLIRETERTTAATGRAFNELLQQDPKMTALVTTHGTSTVGVVRAAAAAGMSIPKDLSVVSIATPKTAETITPPLTTVDFPSYEMGYEAARILVNHAISKGDQTPQQKLFAPDMCLRGSVAEVRPE
jgi:DNA-binding LacI/PurR family transcriptional regulator